MKSQLARYVPPIAVLGFLGGVYLRTLAPGLTWAFDGADGGDLLTAVITGGVPHPTGYPTYVLLASAFLRLPVGSPAYRANLLSAICILAAAAVVYALVIKTSGEGLSASIAALAFGTFPLIWSQAIITEVNALQALFIAAILYFAVVQGARPLRDVYGGTLAGMALGNHMSTLLALPLMALGRPASGAGFEDERRLSIVSGKTAALRVVGLFTGLSVYAIVPLRAAAYAPVNWGSSSTLKGFAWLVSGRMYWDRLSDLGVSYLWGGFEAWSRFLTSQIGFTGLLLIFITLGWLFKRSRLYIATAWLAVAYSGFAILYGSPDSYVYLIPVMISVAIWMGLGGQWLVYRMPPGHPWLGRVVAGAIVVMLAVRALLAIPVMDLSTDRHAEAFAQEILEAAPPRAILLTTGDEATFALWYRHFGLRERPDVALVSFDLQSQPWYRETLARNYPGLDLPSGLFTADWTEANPDRPVCRADMEALLSCQSR